MRLLALALAAASALAQPPGDAMEHYASGYARVMCNAVFVTGLNAEFAEQNVGYFVAPPEVRAKLERPVVDREARTVKVTVPGGSTITARYFGGQGCTMLPIHYRPEVVTPKVDASRPWPMGDAPASGPLPTGLDRAKVKAAVDAAFEPAEGMTAALVVVWKGRIVGERYGEGVTMRTPLESWSMGKSVTATLMGTLIRDGIYTLTQPAPIPEWQAAGDARQKIRIEDLLHMSSGLQCRSPSDPDYDTSGPYADHFYLYTTLENAFQYAATRPVEWAPNTHGRYRNCDPVLVNYLIRLAVEKRREDYLAFPQRRLFDRLGIGTMVIETDPYGNFLTQGYDLACARDWARLGLLYAQKGMWNGERILPAEFVNFVSTVAPAWKADGRPVYGGFFWINGDDRFAIPRDSFSMMGAGGQFVTVIPSRELVVVRLGHFKGAAAGEKSLNRALALLMEAAPGQR